VWVQGCTLGCPGCFNPETHSPDGGRDVALDELFEQIISLGGSIEGVSISGGEPLQQPEAVSYLIGRLSSETKLSVVLFSGYTLDEIAEMPAKDAVDEHVDVLIAGRYDFTRPVKDLRGSLGKEIHFLSDRYSAADIEAVPKGEIIIDKDGGIVITGITPISWKPGGE
jgi:anaerobic ribonucleoside-triphosphate reductase activating protein